MLAIVVIVWYGYLGVLKFSLKSIINGTRGENISLVSIFSGAENISLNILLEHSILTKPSPN